MGGLHGYRVSGSEKRPYTQFCGVYLVHTQGFPLVLEFALYIYVRACDAVEYVNKLALKKVEKKFDGENGVCFDCGIIKPTNTQPTHTQPTNNRK